MEIHIRAAGAYTELYTVRLNITRCLCSPNDLTVTKRIKSKKRNQNGEMEQILGDKPNPNSHTAELKHAF